MGYRTKTGADEKFYDRGGELSEFHGQYISHIKKSNVSQSNNPFWEILEYAVDQAQEKERNSDTDQLTQMSTIVGKNGYISEKFISEFVSKPDNKFNNAHQRLLVAGINDNYREIYKAIATVSERENNVLWSLAVATVLQQMGRLPTGVVTNGNNTKEYTKSAMKKGYIRADALKSRLSEDDLEQIGIDVSSDEDEDYDRYTEEQNSAF